MPLETRSDKHKSMGVRKQADTLMMLIFQMADGVIFPSIFSLHDPYICVIYDLFVKQDTCCLAAQTEVFLHCKP